MVKDVTFFIKGLGNITKVKLEIKVFILFMVDVSINIINKNVENFKHNLSFYISMGIINNFYYKLNNSIKFQASYFYNKQAY